MTNSLIIALQAQTGSGYQTIIMFALILVVFWFFMIRPQMKKQKELTKFRSELKKGDKIVTTGGIYGKIADIKDNVVILEIEDGARMRVDKAAVIKDMSDAAKQ